MAFPRTRIQRLITIPLPRSLHIFPQNDLSVQFVDIWATILVLVVAPGIALQDATTVIKKPDA